MAKTITTTGRSPSAKAREAARDGTRKGVRMSGAYSMGMAALNMLDRALAAMESGEWDAAEYLMREAAVANVLAADAIKSDVQIELPL